MSALSRHPAPALAAVLALVLVLAGCSGSGESTAGVASDSAVGLARPDSGAPEPAPAKAAGAATAASGVSSGLSLAALVDGRDLVRTAELTVRVDDVAAALGAVGRVTAGRGGYVSAESADTAPARPSSARLTVRVPVAGFDTLLGDLAGLGAVLDRQQSTADVTDQVVDVASRVSSAQASLARVRALLDRATTIADIVMLEGELTRRQSDLESLQARQRALADQTALSTISLQLLAPDADAPATDRSGFLGGLAAGWHAFGSAGTALLTVVGAVLPFALLAGVVGALTWPVVRRRRAAAPTAPAA